MKIVFCTQSTSLSNNNSFPCLFPLFFFFFSAIRIYHSKETHKQRRHKSWYWFFKRIYSKKIYMKLIMRSKNTIKFDMNENKKKTFLSFKSFRHKMSSSASFWKQWKKAQFQMTFMCDKMVYYCWWMVLFRFFISLSFSLARSGSLSSKTNVARQSCFKRTLLHIISYTYNTSCLLIV